MLQLTVKELRVVQYTAILQLSIEILTLPVRLIAHTQLTNLLRQKNASIEQNNISSDYNKCYAS